MELKTLLVQKKDGYAIVIINRPDKLNALNNLTITELYAVMKDLNADDAVRAVVLTGSGEKAFVAGADISEIKEQDEITGELFAPLLPLLTAMRWEVDANWQCPVISASVPRRPNSDSQKLTWAFCRDMVVRNGYPG